MNVLITGGAGFIGSHLADALLLQGNHVTIIDDLSTGRMENFAHVRHLPNFQFCIESVMNEVVMDRLVNECDIIFHLASAVGVDLIVKKPVEVIERCILGSEIVLRIANRYKKKVLITSTSEIYGKNQKVPFSENDDRLVGPTTKSRWSYSCSKAIDEFLALAYHKEKKMPVIILRLFNTVGPRQTGQYGMVVPRFVDQAMKNEPITVFGDGSQKRCFTYIGDVIDAIIKLGNHPKAEGQIFNVGSTEEISIADLAEKVKIIIGSNSEIVFISYNEAYEEGFEDMAIRVPDLTKIKSLINYNPKIGLDEIIRKIYQYSLDKENQDLNGGTINILSSTFLHQN